VNFSIAYKFTNQKNLPGITRGRSESGAFLFPPNLFYSLQRGIVSRLMTTNEQLTHQIAAQLQETTPLVVFKIYSIIQVLAQNGLPQLFPWLKRCTARSRLSKMAQDAERSEAAGSNSTAPRNCAGPVSSVRQCGGSWG
jgi:hypothetical protein